MQIRNYGQQIWCSWWFESVSSILFINYRISYDQAHSFSQSRSINYYEVSAKTGFNIEYAFYSMVAMLSSYDSYLSNSINSNRKYIIDEIINENAEKQVVSEISVTTEVVKSSIHQSTSKVNTEVLNDQKNEILPSIISHKPTESKAPADLQFQDNEKKPIKLKIKKKEKIKCCK